MGFIRANIFLNYFTLMFINQEQEYLQIIYNNFIVNKLKVANKMKKYKIFEGFSSQ